MEVASMAFMENLENNLIDNLIKNEDHIKFRKESVQNDMMVLDEVNPRKIITDITESGFQEDPFYVCDLGDIVKKFFYWKEKMPRVLPHYAVKCNDSEAVIKVLAACGAGFDCASKGEIAKVTGLGISSDRIIFANPMKMASHVQYALANDVKIMTYDSAFELHKIKRYFPDAQLVLRIRCEAKKAQCPLGQKFGCDPVTEAPGIIKETAELGLNLIGISFHVGSGCSDPPVFRRAIIAARMLFDLGNDYGYKMNYLDIGGGFPGDTNTSILLEDIAAVVNSSLEEFFPDPKIKVISEPGRFFVSSAYTLACNIYAKKSVKVSDIDDAKIMYYITDGVYGSFNCILFDHQHIEPLVLKDIPINSRYNHASIFGPTCDALDCLQDDIMLPEMDVGDWFIFQNMGAYTLPIASPFNGFTLPTVKYYISEAMWKIICTLAQTNNYRLN